MTITVEFVDGNGEVLLPGRIMWVSDTELADKEISIPAGAATVGIHTVPSSWRPVEGGTGDG